MGKMVTTRKTLDGHPDTLEQKTIKGCDSSVPYFRTIAYYEKTQLVEMAD